MEIPWKIYRHKKTIQAKAAENSDNLIYLLIKGFFYANIHKTDECNKNIKINKCGFTKAPLNKLHKLKMYVCQKII